MMTAGRLNNQVLNMSSTDKRATNQPWRYGGGHTYQTRHSATGGQDPKYQGHIDASKPLLFQVDPQIDQQAQQGYGQYQDLAMNLMQQAQAMRSPGMQRSYIDRGEDQQMRAQQQQLASHLWQRAGGQAPSAAEMQLQRGLEQAQAGALSSARSAYGANPGQALRAALDAQSRMAQGTNAQAAQLRAQEQAGAEQALGNLLSGARGQDVGVNQAQAQLLQGSNQANLQSALQTDALRQSAMQNYLGQGQGALENQLKTQLATQDLQRQALADYFQNVNARRGGSKDGWDKVKNVPVIGDL